MGAVAFCLVLQWSAWGAESSKPGRTSGRTDRSSELVRDDLSTGVAANRAPEMMLAAHRHRDGRRTKRVSKRRPRAKAAPPAEEPRPHDGEPRQEQTQPGSSLPEPVLQPKPRMEPRSEKRALHPETKPEPVPQPKPRVEPRSEKRALHSETKPEPATVAMRVPNRVPESPPAAVTPRAPKIEIVVSHSRHVLLVMKTEADGTPKSLFQCGVGLGGSGFPTPKGTYYVSHIYDNDPWWIPPTNRAWAAGQSPSKKIYGGTMAPLLKKKVLSPRKKQPSRSGDMIEEQVKLDDPGYRFHGTNSPRSIGHNESHGCVRMVPKDAKQVASLIKDEVGWVQRRESENGSYVVLKTPVTLTIVD
ncbi:MAG: L,D-transpeptidase family protein [Thermodesulfobacteriota bacterium]